MDSGTLANFASVKGAFGAVMLYFRIQRKLHMKQQGERVWIPLADWLIILATLVSLLLVMVPLVTLDLTSPNYLRLPMAACGAAAILVSGYVFAILAHYRIFFGSSCAGARSLAEPLEIMSSSIAVFAALGLFLFVLGR
ncbi:hypothetical protein [Candidatus Nitrospira allomarina]|uniref:Uncharacterized protein n=1 Tax=Candidatus Nitrospira allomarina TaxID=3020900 RepID=A0AA96GD22_9BACT|nr:hypothetical protein [Candidatus Nitrospira allomarina]WNM56539.1 hypothetical protein PP769_11150 [Candidatus Nitrospira allomarina]